MTLIEFYDEDQIENIVGCFKVKPDKVIFLSRRFENVKETERVYRTLFDRHSFSIRMEFVEIPSTSVSQIADVIRSILHENQDCIIDCTGGGELELIAVGMVAAEKRKYPLHIHATDICTGEIVDCDNPLCIPSYQKAYLSVDDSILLHGGRAQFDYNFQAQDLLQHEKDMIALWNICRENAEQWNTAVSKINNTRATQATTLFRDSTIKKLHTAGLVKIYSDRSGVRVQYKTPEVKKCMKTSGALLERFTCLLAQKTERFTDIKTGVHIDWEYRTRAERDTVDNEIDVILMKGLCPVYISCKNGRVNDTELYKFNAVATRFGGKYVKKVLLVTDPDRIEGSPKKFVSRAEVMGIEVIPNFGKRSMKGLLKFFNEV